LGSGLSPSNIPFHNIFAYKDSESYVLELLPERSEYQLSDVLRKKDY